jgi:hypothetical protein
MSIVSFTFLVQTDICSSSIYSTCHTVTRVRWGRPMAAMLTMSSQCVHTKSTPTYFCSYPDFDEASFNVTECNCTDPLHVYISSCGCDYPGACVLSYGSCTHFEDAPSLPVAEILPAGIIYALVFLIGTGGNLLVVFVVVHFKNMRTVTNMFLASLSTADLCLIWFCVPIQVCIRQNAAYAHTHHSI